MITFALEKIFGKKKSIQRKIIRTATIYTLIVISLTAFLFYMFVHKSINTKLVEINIQQKEEARDLLIISGRSIRMSIFSIIIITIALIHNFSKKMLNPIKKITDATKQVAAGDFTVELETQREDEIRRINTQF